MFLTTIILFKFQVNYTRINNFYICFLENITMLVNLEIEQGWRHSNSLLSNSLSLGIQHLSLYMDLKNFLNSFSQRYDTSDPIPNGHERNPQKETKPQRTQTGKRGLLPGSGCTQRLPKGSWKEGCLGNSRESNPQTYSRTCTAYNCKACCTQWASWSSMWQNSSKLYICPQMTWKRWGINYISMWTWSAPWWCRYLPLADSYCPRAACSPPGF